MNTYGDRLRTIVNGYRLAIGPGRVERCDPNSVEHYGEQRDAHVRWMLQALNADTPVFRAMRWLCFVQGVLWTLGRLSVDEARRDILELLEENRRVQREPVS